MKKLICFFTLFCCIDAHCQLPENDTIFTTLKSSDSLLFTIGFNTCDLSQFELLLHRDFEFYHDEGGITKTKRAFIKSIKEGICSLEYKPTRIVNEASLQVFPLEKNGHIYGAIQTGEHSFYANEAAQSTYLTSTAAFTHVWLLDNGKWKLSRVLSYNHITPNSTEE